MPPLSPPPSRPIRLRAASTAIPACVRRRPSLYPQQSPSQTDTREGAYAYQPSNGDEAPDPPAAHPRLHRSALTPSPGSSHKDCSANSPAATNGHRRNGRGEVYSPSLSRSVPPTLRVTSYTRDAAKRDAKTSRVREQRRRAAAPTHAPTKLRLPAAKEATRAAESVTVRAPLTAAERNTRCPLAGTAQPYLLQRLRRRGRMSADQGRHQTPSPDSFACPQPRKLRHRSVAPGPRNGAQEAWEKKKAKRRNPCAPPRDSSSRVSFRLLHAFAL
ncbi:hypothetical protein B0H19DRAFT_103710 [Mycena capillaripes]|nr:hypothetical protein B0H19DRAFT_103710 [Mycena capillaripes]